MLLPALLSLSLAAGPVVAPTVGPISGPAMSDARGNPVLLPTFPAGAQQTVNIVNWDSNHLPRVYERSDQLPLTDEEVAKLAKAGFDSMQMVKMIEERRCMCDASADGLI